MTPPGEDPAAGAAESEEVVELSAGEALSFALQLHDTGFFDDAETLYRRILESFPDYPDALHFLGLLCHERGRHSEAVELLERIVAILPENADAHNSLGNALMPLERYAESEACYRKAIALDAGHAQAHNNLGVIFSAQDRHLEAVEAYRTAVNLKPDRADFQLQPGPCAQKIGPESRSDFRLRGGHRSGSRECGQLAGARPDPNLKKLGRPKRRSGSLVVEAVPSIAREPPGRVLAGRLPGRGCTPHGAPPLYREHIRQDGERLR